MTKKMFLVIVMTILSAGMIFSDGDTANIGGNSFIIPPFATLNRPAIEETIRFREVLKAQLMAEGYEQCEIDILIPQIENKIRKERLREINETLKGFNNQR